LWTVGPVDRPADEFGERQAGAGRFTDQIRMLAIAQGDLRSATQVM
jgi:hypothetical protein